MQRAILNVPQTIRSAYESAKVSEEALEQALREQETTALALNKTAIRYNVLARDVETDRAMYQSVLSRIKETSVTKEMKPSNVRIVQPATVPEKPVKPEKAKIIMLGILASLSLSVMLVFFLNSLDRSIKTVDQAEDYLELPVLSAIPKFVGVPEDQRKLIVADEAKSVEAESFRTLRTALSMLGRKEDRRVYLFTSALPAEGKTFCSLNYALSLAQQGLNTLVIDCDLRRPMVEKSLLNTGKRGLGLTDYLTGQKTLSEVVHTTEHENFCYLPAGTHSPNPAELLAKTGIDGLLEAALQRFDRVVIDSAPIHAVSDTLLILNRVQTLCLVVRARRTPRNSVLRAVQILREAEAPLAGVILNLLPRSRGRGYYYYYDSYYDYAYRGNYGEKKAVAA
jgi:capsular exopolysaccharide synthesis family protein